MTKPRKKKKVVKGFACLTNKGTIMRLGCLPLIYSQYKDAAVQGDAAKIVPVTITYES